MTLEPIQLVRRTMNLRRDYWTLLRMQQLSWSINFEADTFSEEAFRISLHAAERRDLVYVYEHDEELLGWLWLDIPEDARYGHIRHVQVAQAMWGHGLGKYILRDAIAVCVEQGCRKLTLNVTKSNHRAMMLYRGLGFTPYEDTGLRQRMVLALKPDLIAAENLP